MTSSTRLGVARVLSSDAGPSERCEMIMHKGGTVVARGSYWNPVNGDRVTMKTKGMLPGGEGRAYLKMSPAGLLIIAPLCGTMFITFLPLFGIGVFAIVCAVPVICSLGSVAITAVRMCCGGAGKSIPTIVRSPRVCVTEVPARATTVVWDVRTDRRQLYAYLA
jgi:hypothetical protein